MIYKRNAIFGVVLLTVFSLVFAVTTIAKKKGWLGVSIMSVNEEVKEDWDLSVDKGVLVTRVIDDSPADEAGIKRGDVILKYEGRSVRYTDELIEYVRKTPPGEKAKIEIDRNGKSKKFQVEIDKNRSKMLIQTFEDGGHGFGFYSYDNERGFLGVDTYDLTDGLREYFDVEDDEGVLVVNIIEESPAEKAGFKSGDIIVKVDKRVIEDSDDLRKAISKHEPDDEVKIEYIRNKKKSSKTVRLGEREGIDGHNFRIFRHKRFAPRGIFHFDSFDMKDFNIEIERLNNEIRIDLDNNLKELKEGLKNLKEELNSVQTFI